jgi:hypothetical protein
MAAGGDNSMIGQFGVGFEEDQSEFLEDRRLKDLVKNHSEFIGVSIGLYAEKSKEMEALRPLAADPGELRARPPDADPGDGQVRPLAEDPLDVEIVQEQAEVRDAAPAEEVAPAVEAKAVARPLADEPRDGQARPLADDPLDVKIAQKVIACGERRRAAAGLAAGRGKGRDFEAQPKFFIKIFPDKTNSTLTIEDSGVGLTKDELFNILGTIAKSGTQAFREVMAAGGDNSMIGQFGVGFYFAYLVADKVRVISKHSDEEQYTWAFRAGDSRTGSFTVQKDTAMAHGEIKSGTKIICYLKEDQSEFLEERRLKDLVNNHSEFIGVSIELYVEKSTEMEVMNFEDEQVSALDEHLQVAGTDVLNARGGKGSDALSMASSGADPSQQEFTRRCWAAIGHDDDGTRRQCDAARPLDADPGELRARPPAADPGDGQVRPLAADPCDGQVRKEKLRTLVSCEPVLSPRTLVMAKEEAAKRWSKRTAEISAKAVAAGVTSPRALSARVMAELQQQIVDVFGDESDSDDGSDSSV